MFGGISIGVLSSHAVIPRTAKLSASPKRADLCLTMRLLPSGVICNGTTDRRNHGDVPLPSSDGVRGADSDESGFPEDPAKAIQTHDSS
jgi:hypothetical protein